MTERILGIDPGGTHVGVSEWEGRMCVAAYELTPEETARRVLADWLREFDVVCAEDYVPQGGVGDGKPGTDTVRLLGLIGWVNLIEHGRDVVLTTRGSRYGALQRPKAVGYPFVGAGKGDHARDAEAVVVAAMRWSVTSLQF